MPILSSGVYGKADPLLKDETYTYIYNEQGNLAAKKSPAEKWYYHWGLNGDAYKRWFARIGKQLDYAYTSYLSFDAVWLFRFKQCQ